MDSPMENEEKSRTVVRDFLHKEISMGVLFRYGSTLATGAQVPPLNGPTAWMLKSYSPGAA